MLLFGSTPFTPWWIPVALNKNSSDGSEVLSGQGPCYLSVFIFSNFQTCLPYWVTLVSLLFFRQAGNPPASRPLYLGFHLHGISPPIHLHGSLFPFSRSLLKWHLLNNAFTESSIWNPNTLALSQHSLSPSFIHFFPQSNIIWYCWHLLS